MVERIRKREVPPPPWRYTDDTEMALSIVRQLEERGTIEQDSLAIQFAEQMHVERGYGQGTYAILRGVLEGGAWRQLSRSGFRGMGSFGNGAAMRSAPLGAYFAEQPLGTVVEQARLSAEITHAHPEGVAGGIAVAVGAALVWQRSQARAPLGTDWLHSVRAEVPPGYTRDAIDEAAAVRADTSIVEAAKALGNGSGVTAPDTVPLCLWLVAHRAPAFDDALWTTVAALGDRDTTCAIVGGIAALRVGWDGIPPAWRAAREPLPDRFQ
jgi:ADP-ribosylglycohydrolase